MAGGVYNTENSSYYLYNGQYFWTLSPSLFVSDYSLAEVWSISPLGNLISWSGVYFSFGIRPVINLKSDVKISSGDGTSIAPYIVK